MCLDNHDVIMLFLHGHLGKSGWKPATDVMQRVTIWGKTWEKHGITCKVVPSQL